MTALSPVRPPSPEVFLPHGMCYPWKPAFLALYVASDALVALACFTILFALLLVSRPRGGMPSNRLHGPSALFVTACGLSQVMDVWTIWTPLHWLAGGIKATTALIAIVASMPLIRRLPEVIRPPNASARRLSNLDLEHESAARLRAEAELRAANATLEARVAERTARLDELNDSLRRDNARFAMGADAAGLGFWSFDPVTRTIDLDDRMCRLYGLPPSAGRLPYARWLEAVHPEDRVRCRSEITESLSAKGSFEIELRIVRPNGDVRHLRSVARIANGDRDQSRVFGVDVDMTDRARADERFRLAIEAAPTGMILMDAGGTIVMVNAQVETLFGYPRAELLGEKVEMLVPERYRQHHPGHRTGFFSLPRMRAMGAGRDLYGRRKDGSEMPVEIGLNPLHVTDEVFVISSIVDLSRQREVEQMRRDFISTVSHELRTPLTSINGALGLLQSGATGMLSGKATLMARIAYRNSERLVRIINDILDMGKLDAGKLTFHCSAISLPEVLKQSIDANGAYGEKFAVRFEFQDETGGERAYADPDRLMQVMTNLLSNAVKFSPRGSTVQVRARRNGARLRVEIEDSGPGIPQEFQSRVFEQFSQADASATRRHEGTGLGLSIARKLVEGMDGIIDFSTVVGLGTVFFFELPIRDATDDDDAPADPRLPLPLVLPTPARSGNSGAGVPKLLYVEDDGDLVAVIRTTMAGRAVVVAARGIREAERLLREESFDMVILDQRLPDGSGMSLLQSVPHLADRSLPVMIFSASPVPAEIQLNVAHVFLKAQISPQDMAAQILGYLNPRS